MLCPRTASAERTPTPQVAGDADNKTLDVSLLLLLYAPLPHRANANPTKRERHRRKSSARGRKPKHGYGAKGMRRRRVKVRRNSPRSLAPLFTSDRLRTPAQLPPPSRLHRAPCSAAESPQCRRNRNDTCYSGPNDLCVCARARARPSEFTPNSPPIALFRYARTRARARANASHVRASWMVGRVGRTVNVYQNSLLSDDGGNRITTTTLRTKEAYYYFFFL